jgi:hypothetical protein
VRDGALDVGDLDRKTGAKLDGRVRAAANIP